MMTPAQQWSSISIRVYLSVFFLTLLFLVCSVGANEVSDSKSSKINFFYVSVFDCQIRLPNTYVLNTREKEIFSFNNFSQDGGIVSVSDYDDSVSSLAESKEFSLVSRMEMDALKVTILEEKHSASRSAPKHVAIIYDDSTVVSIIGKDALSWRDFLIPCRQNRGQTEITEKGSAEKAEKAEKGSEPDLSPQIHPDSSE